MEHQKTVSMKKEETDGVFDQLGLMFLEDPQKTEVPGHPIKPDEELKLPVNSSETEFVEDPLGISWPTDLIKEEPGLNLKSEGTGNIFREDPLKTQVSGLPIKLDPKLKSCMDSSEINFGSDPLGMSWTNNFNKEGSLLSLEADETGTIPSQLGNNEVPDSHAACPRTVNEKSLVNRRNRK